MSMKSETEADDDAPLRAPTRVLRLRPVPCGGVCWLRIVRGEYRLIPVTVGQQWEKQ